MPYLILFVCLLSLDQLTKWLAERFLSFYTGIDLIPHVLTLQLVHNYGAAYGLFQHQRMFLLTVSIGVFIGALIFRKYLATSAWSRIGLVFLLAGTAGNLLDRLIHHYVIDFVWIRIVPVFNISDVCIDIGIALFLIEIILDWYRVYAAKHQPAPLERATDDDRV